MYAEVISKRLWPTNEWLTTVLFSRKRREGRKRCLAHFREAVKMMSAGGTKWMYLICRLISVAGLVVDEHYGGAHTVWAIPDEVYELCEAILAIKEKHLMRRLPDEVESLEEFKRAVEDVLAYMAVRRMP